MSHFEDHLWSQLAREHGSTMRAASHATAALAASTTQTKPTIVVARRPDTALMRRPALLSGTALGVAGLATVGILAISGTSAPPAYAVTTNPDGTVTITLNELSSLPALNRKLQKDAIPVAAVPMTATCSTQAKVTIINSAQGNAAPPTGSTVPASGTTVPTSPDTTQQSTATITLSRDQISSGDVGILGARVTPTGRVTLVAGEVTPPPPSCLNSTAFRAPIHRLGISATPSSMRTHTSAKTRR